MDSAVRQVVAISGDLGSGKSTVGRLLAERMRASYMSTGAILRSIARRRGISILEINKVAEGDPSLDHDVDAELRALSGTQEPTVVDSRMAWWFINDCIPVHLTVDLEVGARRTLGRQADTETYETSGEAREATRRRADSERSRFQSLYDVDIRRLRNYEVVLDTSSADPTVLADKIYSTITDLGRSSSDRNNWPQRVWFDPKRLLPSEMITVLRDLDEAAIARIGTVDYLLRHPIPVVYSYPRVAAVDGHKRLSAALLNGLSLVPCDLLAEDSEEIRPGITTNAYMRSLVANPSRIHDWNEAHGTVLSADL